MGDRITYIASAGDPGGGPSLASWHELVGIEDGYDMETATDIEEFLAGRLNLNPSSGLYSVVRHKPLTLSVGPYAWSEPDAYHLRTADADVGVVFPDGSRLTKPVRFTTFDTSGILLLKGEGGAYIDTGLTLDYSYEFRAEGCAPPDKAGVLIGAYTANTERTTLRVLGASNKAQCMWPGNQEAASTTSGINYRVPFSYAQNATGTTFRQGAKIYTRDYAGTAEGLGSAPILLFNEQHPGNYGNGMLAWAEIRDGGGNVLRRFEPRNVEGEWVMADTANGGQIYRPAVGRLVEVTA